MGDDIGLFLILLLLNGAFSMSEAALTTSRRARLETALRKNPSFSTKKALDLHNNPSLFLSAVQIGITTIGILMGSNTGAAAETSLTAMLQNTIFSNYAPQIANGLVIMVISFLSLLIGELIPKRIGFANPEKIAQVVAIPMHYISVITRPLVYILVKLSDMFVKLFKIKADQNKVTEEEIKAIVEEGVTSGTVEEIEHEIVENIFHLGDKNVTRLMTPRKDIAWLDKNKTIQQQSFVFNENHYSQYPLCDGNIDKVIGMVYIKDLMRNLLNNKDLMLLDIAKPLNKLSENMKVYAALEVFQETKVHSGIVIDEYGNVQGMLTINDLFDSLVGGISQDERIAYEIIQREEGNWLVDGQLPIDDFMKEFDIDEDKLDEEDDFNTISGLAMSKISHFPKVTDKFEWNNYIFEIVDMDENRIDKILVTKK